MYIVAMLIAVNTIRGSFLRHAPHADTLTPPPLRPQILQP